MVFVKYHKQNICSKFLFTQNIRLCIMKSRTRTNVWRCHTHDKVHVHNHDSIYGRNAFSKNLPVTACSKASADPS